MNYNTLLNGRARMKVKIHGNQYQIKKNNCGKLKILLINVLTKKIMNYNTLSNGMAGTKVKIHGNQY